MSDQGWQEFLAAEDVADWVVLHGGALAAGGRIVDDSSAPAAWTLSDRAGNRVCVCAWPDGAAQAP